MTNNQNYPHPPGEAKRTSEPVDLDQSMIRTLIDGVNENALKAVKKGIRFIDPPGEVQIDNHGGTYAGRLNFERLSGEQISPQVWGYRLKLTMENDK